MSKRPSLFGSKATKTAVAAEPEAPLVEAPPTREAVLSPRYPKATTREGKRVVTAYLNPEAFRQLKRLGVDEDAQAQDLLVEAINLLFEKRGLSRIA